jgi:hypothetical protein
MIADVYLSGVPRRVVGDDKNGSSKIWRYSPRSKSVWHDKRGARPT